MSDRSMGDVHSMGNPHFTLDPLNGMTIARQISERLCDIDPANCSYYEGNYNAFIEKLKIKLAEWEKKLAPFKGTKVITYHKTYPYFAKRFNLDVVGTLEPKPGIPPSPTHINELIPMMKREGVKLIIVEPFRERRMSEFVADKTGATIIALPIMPG
ncbi:metal ABC transporter substrate-binding protein, partial [Candidatus Kuenenia stuttgartensis]